MYEAHGDEEEKVEDEDEKEEDEEVVNEMRFGGSSPKHGVKPKLQGVKLYR